MDTIEAKKKRKREQDRARQSKCRAKKKKLKEELKKLKEDLLMKNYKNREAVRKHRERKRKGNTVRGKYKRKIQYIEGDIPATPALKRECKNNDNNLYKMRSYADGTPVEKKRSYRHMMDLNETDSMVIKMSGPRFKVGEKIMLKENPKHSFDNYSEVKRNEVGVIKRIDRTKKKSYCAFPSIRCYVALCDLIRADTVKVAVYSSPKKKNSLPPKHLAVVSRVTGTVKKLPYTDENIINKPQLLGLLTTPCKSISIQTKNGQQKIIYSDKNRTEYVGNTVNGKPHGKGTKYVHSRIINKSKMCLEETYIGDFKNGKEHGNGKVTDNDGWSYDGQWKNGKFHGEGIRQLDDGVIIKGNWKISLMHGKCTISIPKQCAKFEASFVYGEPKGDVKAISINKYSYKQYKNCALTVTDSDSYYEGCIHSYITGKFVSKGDFIFEDYDHFYMHGMVEQTFEDGRRYSGMFSRDYFHGHGTYEWPDDYTFSTLLKDHDIKLKDHDIKLKELSGKFENGFVLEGKLKLNIGDSTASIEFEGVKYELWDLARRVIDWSINLPKLTRKCAMCEELLYTQRITYRTESQTIKTKEELDCRGCGFQKGRGIISIRDTYPYVTLPVQRLPQHGSGYTYRKKLPYKPVFVKGPGCPDSGYVYENQLDTFYEIEMPPCCKSCSKTEQYLEKIHKLKDTRLEYLEKLRKEFYEKNKDRTDWTGTAKRGHGGSYVSANAYNKSKFSFALV